MAKRHPYNLHRDKPDPRDRLLHLGPPVQLKPRINLRPAMPPIRDQGNLGSCTGFAWDRVVSYQYLKQKQPLFVTSPLFTYYNERRLEGSVAEDAGSTIRDGVKALARWGAAPEALWPYNIARFRNTPPNEVYAAAARFQALVYQRVPQTQQALCQQLMAGQPIAFGFTVYESFETDAVAQTGMVPMPKHGEAALGGHAVVLVGYDLPRRQFIVANSWGTGWARGGYFSLPFAYVLNPSLAGDFWVITKME